MRRCRITILAALAIALAASATADPLEWHLYFIADTHMTDSWSAAEPGSLFCLTVAADNQASAVLHGGDFWEDTWQYDNSACVNWWTDHGLNVPLYAAIGNHDFDGYYKITDTPPNGQSYFYQNEAGDPLCWPNACDTFQTFWTSADRVGNYYVDIDSCRVVFINNVIDTTISSSYRYAGCNPPGHNQNAIGPPPDYSGLLTPTSEQRKWIRSTLSTAPTDLIIVVMHRAVIGPHTAIRPNACRLLDSGGLMDDLQAGGVDYILTGDQHIIYVSKAYRGAVHMGCVSGQPIRTLSYDYPDFLSAESYDYTLGTGIAAWDISYIKMVFTDTTLDTLQVWKIEYDLTTTKLYEDS